MLLLDWWRIRPLFDAAFYSERYPDVRLAGMNPMLHYLRHGAAEGRKPNRLFDPDYYLSSCPEARNGSNPLLHFIHTAGRSGNPHPLFDCNAYLAAHPEAAKPGVNPLAHYLQRKKVRQTLSPVDRPVSMEILDVYVEIAFWEDPSGRLGFVAEPQQEPFFRAMRFDQLAAQCKP